MAPAQDSTIPPGWLGGFAQSNPAFAYPPPNEPIAGRPDLSSLPMLDNMANIPLLQRQQGVEWPEFSWETELGNPASRCFQTFSPYISRLGYTDMGRVYSIICPQQGIWLNGIGALNVEITVTGQRGWVDETTKDFAADMTVEGKLWFSPSANQTPFVKLLWAFFSAGNLPFPADKAQAIRVTTHRNGDPSQPIFPARTGEATLFESPAFAQHPAAWTTGNIEVQIGPLATANNAVVDEFNQLVVDAFNVASGNILAAGTLLSWNLWFKEPALVDQQEWQTHAERWRASIDEDHGSPTGPSTVARYFDGTPFSPEQALIDDKVQALIDWLKSRFLGTCQLA